jgi:hypothetical protein
MQSDQAWIGVTGLAFATFGQRPDLLGAVFGPELQSATPEFMRHDPVAALYYGDGQLDCYRKFGLVAVDPGEPDRPVARAFSVPFAFAMVPGGARSCRMAAGTRSSAGPMRIVAPVAPPRRSAPSKSWWFRVCSSAAARG